MLFYSEIHNVKVFARPLEDSGKRNCLLKLTVIFFMINEIPDSIVKCGLQAYLFVLFYLAREGLFALCACESR